MELVLVRHALPVRTVVTSGAADPELAPAGVEQARRVAEYLAEEPFDALYTSPMRRAVETAAPIAARCGLEPVVVAGLVEWDRGATSYVPVEELRAEGGPEWEALRNGLLPDADESPEVFSRRVVAAIEALVEQHRSQRIVVVCHGMVINAYVSHVIGRPCGGAFFAPNYTSLHRIAAATTGERSLVTLNETAHLRGSGLPIGLFQG